MGGGPYRQDCIGPNFPNMPTELLVAAGDDTIERTHQLNRCHIRPVDVLLDNCALRG